LPRLRKYISDKWKDYSTIAISRNAYFENLVSASGDAYQRELAKLGKPVDKSEWFTTPSTVTAYNNPSAKLSFSRYSTVSLF
jgi:putative endopeptidase